jgi:outer membrane protein assembly factor BamE (lipoprotein component of BamABCDE complex)
MRNILRTILSVAIAILVIALAGLFLSGYGQTPKPRAVSGPITPVAQQPLFTEYKGVKLGMLAQEVRKKFGDPVLKDDEMDYYIFSDGVTAQVAYDKAKTVKAISIDFAGGTGAPDYRAVIGTELETRPDGSAYKAIRYEALGFWVSYNRTAGPVTTVTVTIQKIL